MSDSSVPRPPVPSAAPLDRASLERVLARAADLQTSSGDTPEEFTEEQLLELGREVGLSPQNLRQALAEERTRSVVIDEERGLRALLFGPSRARAARSISGKPADMLAAIDAWMQRQELLIVKRHLSDRIVWEPRRDFMVGVKRALKVGGRDYALSHAFEVSATVMTIDESRVHVGLDADFRTQVNRSTEQGLGSGLLGAAVTGSLMFMGVATAVAVAPVFLVTGAGVAAARGYQRRIVARAQLALEQLLDRLERAELPRRGGMESLLGAIVDAASAIPPRRL